MSRYLLLLALHSLVGANNLVPGRPYATSISQSGVESFRVGTKGEAADLKFVVTSFGSGMPQLYASVVAEQPNESASEYSSDSNTTGAFIVIPVVMGILDSLAANFKGKSYCYLSVVERTGQNLNFTIVATFSEPITLVSGVPQSGNLKKGSIQQSGKFKHGSTQQFEFAVASGAPRDLKIYATPISGQLGVYVSAMASPDPTVDASYDYQSLNFNSGEAVTISADSKMYPTQGKLYIAVAAEADALYSVVLTDGLANIYLSGGFPQADTVEANQTKFFNFLVDNPDCALDLALTPLYGDPDLYVSLTSTEPQPGDHSALVFDQPGADSVNFDPADVAMYYIGVGSVEESAFILTGSLLCTDNVTGASDRQTTFLVDGVPQGGQLAQGKYAYYRFEAREDHQDLTISVSRKVGEPSLYIRNDGGVPSKEHHRWQSSYMGDDLITIQQEDLAFCANCNYDIAIYAVSNVTFTVTARTSSALITLQDGQPLRGELGQNQMQHYKFTVGETGGKDLTFTVTGLGQGKVDIFVSNTVKQPDKNNYTWAAQTFRGNSITIAHTDLDACDKCTYYIGVSAFSNTTYTIVASFRDVLTLSDGMPQEGSATKDAFSYFEITPGVGHGDITVTLTSKSGSQSLYISNKKLPELDEATYEWSSKELSEAVRHIVISQKDEEACLLPTCKYYIGVYGTSNGTFVLTASTTLATIPLQNGVPSHEHVDSDQWEYFSYNLQQTGLDFSVVVTPITGDPDLYISLTKNNAHVHLPNKTSFDQQSSIYGGDTLTFYSAQRGTYYIGVTALQNSTFTVTAAANSQTGSADGLANSDLFDVVTLLAGEPQSGHALPGTYKYYRLQLPEGAAKLTMTLTTQAGETSVYVDRDTATETKTKDQAGLPTSKNFTWTNAMDATGVLKLVEPDAGEYIFGVLAGSSSAADFLLVTSIEMSGEEQSIQRLQQGVPFLAELDGVASGYFFVEVDSTETELTISVTGMSGDPDLYVSFVDRHPNGTNNEHHSENFGADSIKITNPKIGKYYIAVVTANAESTVFSVTASVGAMKLVPGQPYGDSVTTGQMQHYTVHVSSNHSDFTMTLNLKDAGDAILLLSNDGQFPTRKDAMWSSDRHQDSPLRNTLTVPSMDAHACFNCTYFISVFGSSYATYSIIATYGKMGTMLEAAHPLTADVHTDAFVYFRAFVLGVDNDVSIDLTTFVGAVEVFVSRSTAQPSEVAHTWKTVSVLANAHILIQKTDVNFQPGTYYIGVKGVEESKFSISLTYQQNPIIRDGVPLSGYLKAGGSYFSFPTQQHDEHVGTINFSVVGAKALGAHPGFDVYVHTSKDIKQPSKTSSIWKKENMTESDVLSIKADDPNFCSNCTYFVGVFGMDPVQEQEHFIIKATTGIAFEILLDNSLVYGAVEAGTWKYYEMYMGTQELGRELRLTLETCTGNADLFVSQTMMKPTALDAQWRSEETRKADALVIQDGIAADSSFFVGVFANSFASSYTLNVATSVNTGSSFPVAGNDGLIKAARSSEGATKDKAAFAISFAPVQSSNGPVRYKILYSEVGSGVVMYTVCGLQGASVGNNEDFEVLPSEGAEVWRVVKDLDTNRDYSFNVLAMDKVGAVAYTYVDGADINRKGGGAWLVVLLVLALFGVSGGVYYWWRKRRDAKQQNWIGTMELDGDDVLHGGASAQYAPYAPPSSSRKGYNRVMDEEQEQLYPL